MTSLSSQLLGLTKPQTPNLERGKKRASLLFNPKEAAGLRKEAVFEIGINGLQELLLKNAEFETFFNTLFSITSKDLERGVQLAEGNTKIDKHIRKFLLLLSPYFLLNCSYKALEWLIYRYSIHEYNKEDLLMLVLPYHESKIAIKIIQIIKIENERDPWYFLKPMQNSGVHLTKQQLLNQAQSNPYFVKCVSAFILDVIQVNKNPTRLSVACNFYCSVLTGALECSHTVLEPVLTQMVHVLKKGLKSDISDFRSASYVIATILLSKCTVDHSIIDEFIQIISNHKNDNMKDETCLLYLIIYQTQTSYKNMPDDAFREIASQQWLLKILQDLNNEGYVIYPFLEVLIKGATINGIEEDGLHYRNFLLKLLNELNIDEEYIFICIRAILDALPAKLKNRPAEVQTWLNEIIEIFEKRYPTQFDTEVYQILSSSDAKRNKLQKILKNTLKFQRKFHIFNKINHPNSLIRKNALKYISKNYNSFEEECRDNLRILLENRLRDEDAEVVKQALSVANKTKLLDKYKLNDILIELLCKVYHDENEWKSILENILQILCSAENSNNFKVIINIIPLLLSKSSEELIYVRKIIQSEWFLNCNLFNNFKTRVDSEDSLDLQNQIFTALNTIQNKTIILKFFDQISNAEYKILSPLEIYSSILILSNIQSKFWLIDEILPLLEIFVKYFTKFSLKSYKMKSSVADNFYICKKGKLPVNGFLECIIKMVHTPRIIQTTNINFSSSKGVGRFLVLISCILYYNNDTHTPHMNCFHEILFKNIETKINFILHLAVYMQMEKNEFQKEILSVALKELKSAKYTGQCMDLKPEIISFLLILMSCHQKIIRKKAFKLSEQIVTLVPEKEMPYRILLNNLFDHQEAIILDSGQLSVVISKCLLFQNFVLDNLVELYCDSKQPMYLVSGLFEVVSKINTIEIFEKTSMLANEILEKRSQEYSEFESNILLKNIQRFNKVMGKKLNKNMSISKFLVLVLKNAHQCLTLNNSKTSPFLFLLEHTEIEDFFSSLPKEIKLTVIDLIVDTTTTSADPKALLVSNKLFKYIDIDTNLIMPQLSKMKEVQMNTLYIGKKNRNIDLIPTTEILDTIEWKKGMRILELLQYKKKLPNMSTLLSVLFDILTRCLDFDEQAALEYPKQLILSLILHICQKLGDRKIPENFFNIESIVKSIRTSTNPQTHYHALLVLTHCAALVPTQVLHNIMPIFTFIGSSVLRHDDAYSFQLITSIIDTVIPILIKDYDTKTITSILQVFVDALLYVPEHRRITLYTHLLHKINSKQYLHLFLLLVFVSHVSHSNRRKTDNFKHKFEDDSTFKILDVATNITREFSSDIIFCCIIDLIKYLRELPIEQENLESLQPNIGLSDFTAKQFRHFKYSILLFINRLICSTQFINRIAELPHECLSTTESYFKDIIVSILCFIQTTSFLIEKNSNTTHAQYWKAIQFQSLEILDGINTLLTTEVFLLVTKGLLNHNSSHVQKRILDLLNTKLLRSTTFVEECRTKDISDLINTMLATINNLSHAANENELLVVQTALLSLKLITKNITRKDFENHIRILKFITNLIISDKAEGNILSSTLLCLAELCVSLRTKALHCIPHLMPVLIRILKQQKYQNIPTLLCSSLLTCILKIIENLSLFISPYLKKLICEVCQLSIKWENVSANIKVSPLTVKLIIIKQKLAGSIEPRVLIPAVQESYTELVEKNNVDAIGPLMEILKQKFTYMSSTAVTANLHTLSKFFMSSLEYRSNAKSNIEQKNNVESKIIAAFLGLVLKLSETSFRPLYYRIFNWALRTDSKNERIITFYSISRVLVKHLKSLFIPFSGIFLNNCGQILDACNKKKSDILYFDDLEKNVLLLESVLETLLHIFKHTAIKFIDKERFSTLMKPLVDNLENDLDSIDELEKRNEEFLIPCIVQFALATSDDALWKKMNYHILLKMRHTDPSIRLMALKCLSEVVKNLGEDFLPLLPETIPFLSELLEDEHENIEKSCRKTIQDMEQILNENLQKYF